MMQTSPSPSPQETADETLLRATLQEHAPASFDLDAAWSKVAAHMQAAQPAQRSSRSRPWLFGASHWGHLRWGRRTAIATALALLSLLLVGAGFAVGYLFFWGGPFGDPGIQLIGDQHLYQDIGQRQQSTQVTITVTKAYADPGRTLIAYDMQVPASLAKKYSGITVASFSVSDQDGEEPAGGNIECTAFPRDGSPMHCLLSLPPFHPAAGVSQLHITLDITQVYLLKPGPQGGTDIRTGSWHFQFSLPMHQQNLGPGGPYAQPTRHP